MKTTNDYITILRKYLSTKADAYGITKIGIFGSVAKETNRPKTAMLMFVWK